MTFGAYGTYFDESERLVDAEPLCVAGFTFKPSKYRQFCTAWGRLLQTAFADRVLTAMHMTDLVQGKKEFQGTDIPARVRCLRRAVNIICDTALIVTGSLIDQKEFEAVAGPDWPQHFGSCYTTLCQRAAQNTADLLKSKKWKRPVVYTFESGHKWAHETDQVFKAIQSSAQLKEVYQYGHHTFALKVDCYGAQASDIAAWAAVRARVRGSVNSVRPFAPELIKLVRHFDRKGRAQIFHLTGDHLTHFVDQQKARPKDDEVRCPVGPAKRKFR